MKALPTLKTVALAGMVTYLIAYFVFLGLSRQPYLRNGAMGRHQAFTRAGMAPNVESPAEDNGAVDWKAKASSYQGWIAAAFATICLSLVALRGFQLWKAWERDKLADPIKKG